MRNGRRTRRHCALGIRTWTYCRRVSLSAYDGHLAARPFQERAGLARVDASGPASSSVTAEIDARAIWSGDAERDEHLRNPDFLDVENYPKITFVSRGGRVQVRSPHEFLVNGDLTLRGMTRQVSLDVEYLGQWETPYWENGVYKGPMVRAGFLAHAVINRHDYGVSWNAQLDRGGVVVGDNIFVTLDVEALRKK